VKRRYWTPAEEAYMRSHYADTDTAVMAAYLGCSVQRVLRKANDMGLHKTVAHIARVARQRSTAPDHGSQKTRFQAGLTPWNKGVHYVAGGRSAETRFKPGNKTHTWKPVGSYRIAGPHGFPELQRKVNDDPGPSGIRWKPVSRLVWEAAHGPVPAGHVVVFRPGCRTLDPERITLDALELITRQELMRRNSVHRLPPEFAELARLKGALVNAINHRLRQEGNTA
jgi:hypothetical protein